MFVRSFLSSNLGASVHELTIVPIRFLYAQTLKLDPCLEYLRWSRQEAQGILPTTNSDTFSMKILCWNCRGGANTLFEQNIMDLVNTHDPMLVFITETKLPAYKVEPLRVQLRFDSADGIDALGLSGGIWVLWDSNRLDVQVLPHGQQALHLILKIVAHQDSSSESEAHLS